MDVIASVMNYLFSFVSLTPHRESSGGFFYVSLEVQQLYEVVVVRPPVVVTMR